MTLDALIILAGAIVALLPFLGFPSSWDSVLFFLLGVAIIGLGVAVRRRGPSPVEKRDDMSGFRDIHLQGSEHDPL